MKTKYFKDISIGQDFYFGDLMYIKTKIDFAISLAGGRMFNIMEIVSVE